MLKFSIAKITEDKKTTDQLYLLIILKERLHLSIGIHNYNDTFCSFRNMPGPPLGKSLLLKSYSKKLKRVVTKPSFLYANYIPDYPLSNTADPRVG